MKSLTILLALILTACAADNAPAPPSLAGTHWDLKSMPGYELSMAMSAPTLIFQSDTRAGGNSGCNGWGGSYTLKGNDIRFGQLMMTEMACVRGMDVERRYADMLDHARHVAVTGDALTLLDESGAEIARFTRVTLM